MEGKLLLSKDRASFFWTHHPNPPKKSQQQFTVIQIAEGSESDQRPLLYEHWVLFSFVTAVYWHLGGGDLTIATLSGSLTKWADHLLACLLEIILSFCDPIYLTLLTIFLLDCLSFIDPESALNWTKQSVGRMIWTTFSPMSYSCFGGIQSNSALESEMLI